MIPRDYENLFKPEIRDKLKLLNSYERSLHDTVSNFLYDGKLNVQIYKLSDRFNLSLKHTLIESYQQSELENDTVYYSVDESPIEIMDRVVISKIDKPTNIFISLYGNNSRIVAKGDSLADYYLEFKNLSIKYKADGPLELFAQVGKLAHGPVPLEILFIRQNNKLYILFISPTKGNQLYPGTFYN